MSDPEQPSAMSDTSDTSRASDASQTSRAGEARDANDASQTSQTSDVSRADEARRRLPLVPQAPRPPEDVGLGLRFNHLLLAHQRSRIDELSASLYALLETLIADGALRLDHYEARRQLTMQRENERLASEPNVSVSTVADKYALTELPAIDCDARLPLCKARCCTLTHSLSVQDLDERVVRWDYAAPYRIAKTPSGMCVHNDAGRCEVYEHRPAICRTYSCRDDRRIWLDFDARVPAP